MICDNCKKFFMSGNRPDGIPNGVKMIMKNNESITLCVNCLISVGAMSEKEKDGFFMRLRAREQ